MLKLQLFDQIYLPNVKVQVIQAYILHFVRARGWQIIDNTDTAILIHVSILKAMLKMRPDVRFLLLMCQLTTFFSWLQCHILVQPQ